MPALFHSVTLCSKLSVRYQSEVRFYWELLGFAGGSDGKGPTCNAGDLGSNPELEKSLGEGNGNPLQHSHLKNTMDRGAWRATVMGPQRVGHDLGTNTHTNCGPPGSSVQGILQVRILEWMAMPCSSGSSQPRDI